MDCDGDIGYRDQQISVEPSDGILRGMLHFNRQLVLSDDLFRFDLQHQTVPFPALHAINALYIIIPPLSFLFSLFLM